jgi:hypothetical protein
LVLPSKDNEKQQCLLPHGEFLQLFTSAANVDFEKEENKT